MQNTLSGAIAVILCILLLFSSGCLNPIQSSPMTPIPLPVRTTVPTPTPVKEVVYVYITVTVTPAPPPPVPTPSKDSIALSDLPAYNAWRYQSVSKGDGEFRYGPVTALLIHLDKAPDEKSYELYYQSGRRWKEDLEQLIDNVNTYVPQVQSAGMRNAISDYTINLTIQNETIRTLDRVMTNWEYAEAGKVTNAIVLNITNATRKMDDEVALLV